MKGRKLLTYVLAFVVVVVMSAAFIKADIHTLIAQNTFK